MTLPDGGSTPWPDPGSSPAPGSSWPSPSSGGTPPPPPPPPPTGHPEPAGWEAPPPPGSWAPPPPPPQPGTQGAVPQLASWGVRFGASLLDFVIVMIPLSIVLNAAGVGTFNSGDDGASYSVGSGGSLLNIAAWFLYTALMHGSSGQTIGKKIVKIRVVAAGGVPLGSKTWIRSGVQSLLWITCLGGLLDHLWPLWDKDRQALHDKAAGTYVVRVG